MKSEGLEPPRFLIILRMLYLKRVKSMVGFQTNNIFPYPFPFPTSR
jgi:hypothetical protein